MMLTNAIVFVPIVRTEVTAKIRAAKFFLPLPLLLTRISICDTSTAIRTFRCKETRALFDRQPSRQWRDIEQVTRRKLEQLHAAASLDFLRVPPGNRLEALRGDRKGQHAIRNNNQWRLCFRWTGSDAEDVEIVDYH